MKDKEAQDIADRMKEYDKLIFREQSYREKQ